MSKVLITGVAGLLGSHFSRHLLDKGHVVYGIDNYSGGYSDFVDPRVKMRAIDLQKTQMVDGVFAACKPDYVYHFAAYAAVGLSPFIRNYNYMNNVVASANVINGCVNHGVKKIIFTSSMDVYGSAYEPPYTEDMRPVPEDPYGIAKFAVEQDLAAAGRLFDLRYSIVRPHNVFGVYQNIWDKYRNVLGIWIRQILSGQPMTIYGDGEQVRSFSDIVFYMEPFEKLMEAGEGEVYNIGADQYVTINQAADTMRNIARKHGFNPTIIHLEARDEVKSAYCDHAKAKIHLKFNDDTNLDELLDKMFVWASNQPQRQIKNMPYEIEKNMYSYWK